VIKAKKKIQTVITLDMDEDSVDQLDKWLVFAGGVWTQIRKYPMLWDEIFHDAKILGYFPAFDELSVDKNVAIRLALKNAEVIKE